MKTLDTSKGFQPLKCGKYPQRSDPMKYVETLIAVLVILGIAYYLTDGRSGNGPSVVVSDGAGVEQTAIATPRALKHRTMDAFEGCAQVIASHFGLPDWSNVPFTENYEAKSDPATKNFYFAWPEGRIQLRTAMGDVPISAACIGTLDPLELKWVTVNGKDVL